MDEITTKRSTLRRFRPTDAEDLAAGLSDFDTCRWLVVVPFPYRRSDAEAFIARSATDRFTWAVVEEGRLAGSVSCRPHLGYWLAPPFRGRGLMREAAHAALADFFANSGEERIVSGYLVGNDASGTILRALGFRETGRSSVLVLSRAESVEHVDMALERAVFETLEN
ncbi:MAG: GNAT family N-acetyltransferase [Geminicoccaceae bacterium]